METPVTSNEKEIDLTLNTEGLITSKKNKSQFLKLTTNATHTKKIIAITETWLRSEGHYDAEILKQFPSYNITRADRDILSTPEDTNKLKSRGWCMLLTSPGIIAKPEVSFSNGNCEVLITELEEGNIIIVMYNPPKPNFVLNKFEEAVRQ